MPIPRNKRFIDNRLGAAMYLKSADDSREDAPQPRS